MRNKNFSVRTNNSIIDIRENLSKKLGVNKNRIVEVALMAINDNFTDDMLLLYYDTIIDELEDGRKNDIKS
jgi:hypothetical protein